MQTPPQELGQKHVSKFNPSKSCTIFNWEAGQVSQTLQTGAGIPCASSLPSYSGLCITSTSTLPQLRGMSSYTVSWACREGWHLSVVLSVQLEIGNEASATA